MKKIISIIFIFAIVLTWNSNCKACADSEPGTVEYIIGCAAMFAGIGASFVTTPITSEYWTKCHNERELRQAEHNDGKKQLGKIEKTKLIIKECVAAAATFMTPAATVIVTCIPGLLVYIPIYMLTH